MYLQSLYTVKIGWTVTELWGKHTRVFPICPVCCFLYMHIATTWVFIEAACFIQIDIEVLCVCTCVIRWLYLYSQFGSHIYWLNWPIGQLSMCNCDLALLLLLASSFMLSLQCSWSHAWYLSHLCTYIPIYAHQTYGIYVQIGRHNCFQYNMTITCCIWFLFGTYMHQYHIYVPIKYEGSVT